MSGVACAARMADPGVRVDLRERGQALGGRMASRTLRDTGTAFDGRVVDIGASYFTAQDPEFRRSDRQPRRPGCRASVDHGLSRLRAGWPHGHLRWARALCRAERASERRGRARIVGPGLQIHLSKPVDEVVPAGSRVQADGVSYPAVALAMPEPQAVRVLPDSPSTRIPWEPVIAVTCVFDKQYWTALDGAFVNDDPVLTWIADDGSRRGDGAPVLVAHVNPVLAARHLADPDTVIPWAIAAIQRILGIEAEPSWADAHRWTYAKPLVGSELPYWLHERAPLGQAGDAWAGGPRVEAAAGSPDAGSARHSSNDCTEPRPDSRPTAPGLASLTPRDRPDSRAGGSGARFAHSSRPTR